MRRMWRRKVNLSTPTPSAADVFEKARPFSSDGTKAKVLTLKIIEFIALDQWSPNINIYRIVLFFRLSVPAIQNIQYNLVHFTMEESWEELSSSYRWCGPLTLLKPLQVSHVAPCENQLPAPAINIKRSVIYRIQRYFRKPSAFGSLSY